MSKFGLGTEGTGLSGAGERRREAILTTLQQAMTTRRRRRRGLRIAGALGAVVLVAGAVLVLTSRAGRTTGSNNAGTIVNGRGSATDGHVPGMFVLLGNDPGIIERMAVKRGAAVPAIDDDELAKLLEEAGRLSGMVRTRGRVYLGTDLSQEGQEAAPGT